MFDLDAIMTTDLVTVTPDETLADARALLHEHRIHHLPVVRGDGHLVGLVTLTDVLAASDSALRSERTRLPPQDVLVSDIMVTDVATVSDKASVRQAALFIEKHRIGCLPVVVDGVLKGIITDTDFVGVAINLLEQLESSEPVDDDLDVGDVA